jgi:formylmethanofuran dehydrogenase subunit E
MIDYADVLRFHGHACPGLAIGYRLSCAAMAALNVERAGDDELVAIVENDACGIDAVQYLTGCTFGKGNLVFLDYGKSAYTFCVRATGAAVRVVFHRDRIPAAVQADRPALASYILAAPEVELISVTTVTVTLPERARVQATERCTGCGEPVMASRLQDLGEMRLCVPCAQQQR